MQVNVNNIKSNLHVLDSLICEYEDDMINYYNEMKFVSNNWQDKRSLSFFENISIENNNGNKMLEELRELCDVYKYLLELYEKIGNKIFFDLSNKDKCLQEIDEYLERLKEIIKDYNNLDLSFCEKEKYLIENEKQTLMEQVYYLEQIKKDLQKVFDDIEEIEKNVKFKLSKINIEIIKETDLGLILKND